jgi:hypothetical protein
LIFDPVCCGTIGFGLLIAGSWLYDRAMSLLTAAIDKGTQCLLSFLSIVYGHFPDYMPISKSMSASLFALRTT